MAVALYRKFRPTKFKDILGQSELVTVLENAARRDKLAHAYLFYGPRGTGKTTAARIIAKVANCETRRDDAKFRSTGEPCNTCRPCTEIDLGRALDVVEIDGASNRGIDEIRALKESIRLSPTSYTYKVFIIDEAHQLTKEAWNALLKTLEEPPAHAIFILATTEYEKVPATIASRTQRFHFKKPGIPEIVEKLTTIIRSEKLSVADDAIELIAASGEGSFRDAESLLDQLTAIKEEVTVKTVEEVIGTVGFERISTLADHIFANDITKALEAIRDLSVGGTNIVQVVKELISYLRRVLTLSIDPKFMDYFAKEFTRAECKRLQVHSSKIIKEKHIPLIRALITAWEQTRYSPFASLPLEVTLIEYLSKK